MTIDISRFSGEMARLQSELPRAVQSLVRFLGYRGEHLMKRKPPIPVRTGKLRGSCTATFPGPYEAVIAPHTDYAEKMERRYGYVEKAGEDLGAEAEERADEILGRWESG